MSTTLINTRDNHNKFYHIELRDRVVTLHWGRIGTRGQQQTHTFSFPSTARTFALDKLSSKLGRGYSRVR